MAYWFAQEGTKYLAEIRAYQDPPMTLDGLAYGPADQTGYQLHHIVEQTPAEQDGFPRSQIDGDENLVYVPTLKHREISAWYQKQNPNYGGLSQETIFAVKIGKTDAMNAINPPYKIVVHNIGEAPGEVVDHVKLAKKTWPKAELTSVLRKAMT